MGLGLRLRLWRQFWVECLQGAVAGNASHLGFAGLKASLLRASVVLLASGSLTNPVLAQTHTLPDWVAQEATPTDLSPTCPEKSALADADNTKRFLHLTLVQQDEALMALKGHEPVCLKSPQYYALLGQDLLLANRAQDAIEALERSLLLNAEQPGVQLDFAQALALTGDTLSADSLLHQILARSDVPEALRLTMEGLLEGGWGRFDRRKGEVGGVDLSGYGADSPLALASSVQDPALNTPITAITPITMEAQVQKAGIPEKTWTTSGSLQSLLGYDSNLNSASYTNTINLTLPNGVVPLLLDAASLPQAGPTQVYAAQGQAQRSFGDQALSVSGTWMQRQTPNTSNLGFRNQEIAVQWRPKNQLGWTERGVLTHFELGGFNFFEGLSYSMWKEWRSEGLAAVMSKIKLSVKDTSAQTSTLAVDAAPGQGPASSSAAAPQSPLLGSPRAGIVSSQASSDWACHYLAGFELNRRTYAQDRSQNGTYLGALGGGLCSSPYNQVNLTLQGGLDQASDASRAGGNQQRQEFKLQWLHAFEHSRVGLEWGQQRLWDAQIYSELLGGVVRNTLRQNIKLSLDYVITEKLGMIGGSMHWVSFWETLRYRSSVDLFNMKGESVQTGVKWDF